MGKAKPMDQAKRTDVVSLEQITHSILVFRGHKVLLDAELAALYGVTTSRLNEAIKRNLGRFPPDFMFQLTSAEHAALISQIATSKPGRGGRRKLPWVFSEHGVAMLASVLKSPQAARVNIEIIRAFVRLRRLLATPGELISQINELAKTVNLHDEHIRAITDVLKRMMEPPAASPKPRIGFRAEMRSRNSNLEPSVDGEAR